MENTPANINAQVGGLLVKEVYVNGEVAKGI